MITLNRLQAVLHYDPSTGIFTWKVATSGNTQPGMTAGCVRKDGRRSIRIDGKTYLAYRLAFMYMTGDFPEGVVDHINRVPGDDRWTNLRAASQAENCRNTNMSSNNTSGYKGVSWNKNNQKWRAYIKLNYRKVCLGCFTDLEEAARVADEARTKHFGEFFESIPANVIQTLQTAG